MKTIQIPSCGGGEKPLISCFAFGEDMRICFLKPGEFDPDPSGSVFNPPLVAMTVRQWQVAGPYHAPEQEVDVNWTFTPLGSAADDSGTIEVGCLKAQLDTDAVLAMKTIQIPGSKVGPGHDDEVGYGTQVVLEFTEDGVFWRSREANYFTPPLFLGFANTGFKYEATSPERDAVVRWRFIAEDGTETDGNIYVKQDADVASPEM